MAKIDLTIPSLGNNFVDLRDTIPGDSYNWSWVRSLSQVNYLAIHHTAGPDTQTPDQIANFHINSNGWGGIGYHFLIARDGTVYYVGDISTARANVANLNDAVIGICLIGNFTAGRVPTDAQLSSANKLCEFFIGSYPDLPNINSWDDVKGHKDLPGQSTTCPGDDWPGWRVRLVEGGAAETTPSPTAPTTTTSSDRGAQISELYRGILGRDPDMGGLQTYTNGSMSLDQIMRSMVESEEHRLLVRNAKEVPSLKSSVDSLQTTLASVNQQVIILQETIQEREKEIAELKNRLTEGSVVQSNPEKKPDNTLTIFQALFNLYKFVFMPGKVNPA